MKLLVRSLLILTFITNGLSFAQAIQGSEGLEVFDIKKGVIIQTIQHFLYLQKKITLLQSMS